MKLISWNIQWCRGCDGRVDPARIVAHARALADFDVLCLQEVAANFPALAGSQGEDQFAAIAALLPGYTALRGIAVDVAAPDGRRREFGNMILSRYPVTQVQRIRLPWPSDPAVRSMPRLLLDATVEAPFGLLRVMTTHLEYYSQAQRAAQVEALRAHHAEACGRALHDRPHDTSHGPFHSHPHATAAILTGDFNFRPEDPLRARIEAPFAEAGVPALDDVWRALHPGEAQAPTSGVHDREQWPEPFACDFVFATRDLRDRLRSMAIDADTEASDHQPIVVELD
jgi:endonuclease/exonuclease/phosphatase family metal-dependent hydrolase